MFLEHKNHRRDQRGWIEVICGSMFSGKTEELLRRIKRAEIARLRVQIFKPAVDVRYSEDEVVSHDATTKLSIPVSCSKEILTRLEEEVDVVGIDEAQFFDEEIVEVCEVMANKGIRVIIAGLDMDYTGKPFGAMPILISKAEFVAKVHAICMKCGHLAQFSHRISENRAVVELGAKNKYEPLCRDCFNKAVKQND